jgi:hypothetical protein
MNATTELLRIKADLTPKQINMIKENEVIDLLGNEFPSINDAFEKTPNPGNIYKAMQCFADFTKQLIRKGDFKEVKHCFIVAEKMLQNGNAAVKNSIENCYLFSVSAIIDITGPISEKVKGLLTDSLKKEYNRQVCSSGI